MWADNSVESPLPSDFEGSGSQRAVAFEDSGFSINSGCELKLLDFAMERRQLLKITEHSRETTYVSLDSEDSANEFGSSSDFGVLHLPLPSRTNNHMVQVFGTPDSVPGVDELSNNNSGADLFNFGEQFELLHIACPIQDLRYASSMNEASNNSSEIQQDGNGSASIIAST
jgi:hypothetical protein